MIKKPKIYIVGAAYNYANWLEFDIVRDMFAADLVMFTGGSDVSPRLYNQPEHPNTSCIPARDKAELIEFEAAFKGKKPMIGICRGAQFLCVMAGGILVQHQHHPNYHDIITQSGEKIQVTSDHHQRQYPFHMELGVDWIPLAWTSGLSPIMEGAGLALPNGEFPPHALEFELEVAYYPKIRALGIQCHPEWMSNSSPAVIYFRKLVDQLMADSF